MESTEAEINESSVESTPNPENLEQSGSPQREPPQVAPAEEPPVNELELLAEQFANYLRIAKALLSTFRRPRDAEIAAETIRQLEQHNDKRELEIRRNNNEFFRYFLRILKTNSQYQPIAYYNAWYQEKEEPTEPITESRTWLEENKSYIAIKSLSDGSSVLYAAVSSNPEAGWQDGGLKILEQRGAACKVLKRN